MPKPSKQFADIAAQHASRRAKQLPVTPLPAAQNAPTPVPQETPAPKRGLFSKMFGSAR